MGKQPLRAGTLQCTKRATPFYRDYECLQFRLCVLREQSHEKKEGAAGHEAVQKSYR